MSHNPGIKTRDMELRLGIMGRPATSMNLGDLLEYPRANTALAVHSGAHRRPLARAPGEQHTREQLLSL